MSNQKFKGHFQLTDKIKCHLADDNLWIEGSFSGSIDLYGRDRKSLVAFLKKATFCKSYLSRKFRANLDIHLESIDDGRRNMIIFMHNHSMVINIKQSVIPELAIWLQGQRTYTEMSADKSPP